MSPCNPIGSWDASPAALEGYVKTQPDVDKARVFRYTAYEVVGGGQ